MLGRDRDGFMLIQQSLDRRSMSDISPGRAARRRRAHADLTDIRILGLGI